MEYGLVGAEMGIGEGNKWTSTWRITGKALGGSLDTPLENH